MESNPTVFAEASEISVSAIERGPIKLSAPGFAVEIASGYGSLHYSLRSLDEENTRKGYEQPLSTLLPTIPVQKQSFISQAALRPIS